jgi:hypothetical protein
MLAGLRIVGEDGPASEAPSWGIHELLVVAATDRLPHLGRGLTDREQEGGDGAGGSTRNSG